MDGSGQGQTRGMDALGYAFCSISLFQVNALEAVLGSQAMVLVCHYPAQMLWRQRRQIVYQLRLSKTRLSKVIRVQASFEQRLQY